MGIKKANQDMCKILEPDLFDLVDWNKAEKIAECLEKGADIEKRGRGGHTPLMLACALNAKESVEVLLKFGADVNAVSESGMTPLMFCSFKDIDSAEAAKLMVSDKRTNLEARTINGFTALMKAAMFNSVEVLKVLIKTKLNLNGMNNIGETALHLCMKKETSEAAILLINAGANVSMPDNMGITPIIKAAMYDNDTIIKKLVFAGANANKQEKCNCNAIITAMKNNSTETIKYYLREKIVTKESFESMVVGAGLSRNDTIQRLVIKQCSNDQLRIMFFTACVSDNIFLVKKFLKNKDLDLLNARFYFRMTPLMIACYENASSTVEELIKCGADINLFDADGVTALMYAASINNRAIMKLLQKNGADKTIKDKEGKTFEEYAKKIDLRPFHQMLKERREARKKLKCRI